MFFQDPIDDEYDDPEFYDYKPRDPEEWARCKDSFCAWEQAQAEEVRRNAKELHPDTAWRSLLINALPEMAFPSLRFLSEVGRCLDHHARQSSPTDAETRHGLHVAYEIIRNWRPLFYNKVRIKGDDYLTGYFTIALGWSNCVTVSVGRYGDHPHLGDHGLVLSGTPNGGIFQATRSFGSALSVISSVLANSGLQSAIAGEDERFTYNDRHAEGGPHGAR